MDDFSQFNINDVSENDSPSPLPPELNRKRLLKFAVIFVVILGIIGGGYFAWTNYFSPSAYFSRQATINYQKYLDQQKRYETAMTADTYGGKTPEETLELFKQALINKDVDLASNYFLLDDNGERNVVIKQNIQKFFDENKVNSLLDILSKLKPSAHETASPSTKEFVYLTPQGIVEYSITLKLNKYSNVWKIENM